MSTLPPTFKLERYFDKYEFTTKYLLCCSDAEALSMNELLDLADEQCKELWKNLLLCYTEAKGHHLLRQEVANLHGVTSEDIVIVTPQEGIYIAMKCLVNYLNKQHNNQPFHAVATFPAYQSLYENLKTSGCDLSYWTVKETAQGWVFDYEELKSLLKKDTKLLVVNFPHNPTGFVPSKEAWDQLIQLCKERNIFLFSDEMYRLSNNDQSQALPSASALMENSITLFGMSKTFAMPGLRIGWLATRHIEIMNMMHSFKDYITICPPAPSEILSIIGVRNKEKLIQHTMNIIKPNLDKLDSFFSKHNDIFTWYKPQACTTGFVKVKGWLLKLGKGGASGFCEKLVQEKQVLLLPGAMYDFPDEFVRLSFGRKNMKECLEVLEEFINENRPSTN